jgi:hypothetical protein
MKRKNTSAATSYSVGYGKPPETTRFRPGKSGNLKGRPGRKTSAERSILKVLDEQVTVAERGVKRSIPAIEVIYRRLRSNAMNGDVRAARFLLEQKEKHSKRSESQSADPQYDLSKFSDEELETFLRLTECLEGTKPIAGED